MKRPPFLLCAAVAGCVAVCAAPQADSGSSADDELEKAIRKTMEALFSDPASVPPENRLYRIAGEGNIAKIAPGLGGRLMFFGAKGGTNALWTAAPGAPVEAGWRNWGGEKTWVGDMSLWRGFDPQGRRWPPPAWFDQDEFEWWHPWQSTDLAGPHRLSLRQPAHASGDWNVALERDFILEDGRLVVRETLLPEPADAPQPPPEPDDPHRIWSVTQVPFAPRLAARLCGEGRTKPSAGFPEEPTERHGDWVVFDLSAAPDKAALAADADALAVEGPAGWLVVSQRADARFLGPFATPGRALVYTTGAKLDDPAAAYTELEFVALGRDAAHEIAFALAAEPPWAD